MTFSQRYKKMNESFSPDQTLKAAVLEQADRCGRSGKQAGKRRLRPAFAAALALACLVFFSASTCALAAENKAFNSVLYKVAPGLAQFFKPVNLSCEDNGIRVELESAAVDGDTARAYVTLRDLTGDRIDETVDLYDSARFRIGKDCAINCQLVEFEEKTKTARFLLTVQTMDGSRIAGNKLTFQAGCFLSHKTEYKNVEVPVEWEKLPEESPFIEASGCGFDTVRVLRSAKPMDWPVEGIDLTGIGFLDGKLHIQTYVKDNLKKDNHGYFWLENEAGDQIRASGSVYSRDSSMAEGDCRVDYVFDLSPGEAEGYAFKGDFWTCDQYTEGDWEITFPVG